LVVERFLASGMLQKRHCRTIAKEAVWGSHIIYQCFLRSAFEETEGQYISYRSKYPVLRQDSKPILFIDLDSNETNYRFLTDTLLPPGDNPIAFNKYEGWNFNSGNYLFTTDTK